MMLVTTSAGGARRTQLWDGAQPLGIGHPLRWLAERSAETGMIRLRSLQGRSGEVLAKDHLIEIAPQMIESGSAVEIPSPSGGAPLTLKIVSARTASAAFTPDAETSEKAELYVFTGAGAWVSGSLRAGERYDAQVRGENVFSLTRHGRRAEDGYMIRATAEGLRLCFADGHEQKLGMDTNVEASLADLSGARIESGRLAWRFRLVETPAIPAVAPQPDSAEARGFAQSLRYSMVALGAFAVLSWIWPAADPTKEEELVPPQFAKLVMSPPKRQAPAAESSKSAGGAKAQQKVQNTAVVQAMRAKALTSSMSKLLKGGMTTLLAQSDFVSGKNAAAASSKMFDSKSEALRAAAPVTGAGEAKKVAVASLGDGKEGAGYKKGDKAGVQGQGQAFVSLDAPGASVEEGLTKDEVGEVIHRHMSEIRYCYEAAMVRTPDVEGKLLVDFTIGAGGLVKTSSVKDSTLPDPRLDDCILRRLASWKFPTPKGGIEVAVSYPFIFKTLGR